MKPSRKYASATAFRVALESRLKKLANEETLDLQRLRRQTTFDRLLCRVFAIPDAPWLLKGGYRQGFYANVEHLPVFDNDAFQARSF